MSKLIGVSEIREIIIELRGHRLILDTDLAMLYQVPTKRLIEQVKRNKERFPADFVFQLTKEEWAFLKSQIATSKRIPQFKRKLPYVFTRNGANMVCAVLRTPVAVQRSVQIMRAFSSLEEVMSTRRKLITQSPSVLNKLSVHSRAIMCLFQKDKIKTLEIEKVRKIIKEMILLLQNMVLRSE